MTVVAYALTALALLLLLSLLLTDRWGNWIGTRNWRASRSLDRHLREIERDWNERA